jgi:hypothetical protein
MIVGSHNGQGYNRDATWIALVAPLSHCFECHTAWSIEASAMAHAKHLRLHGIICTHALDSSVTCCDLPFDFLY